MTDEPEKKCPYCGQPITAPHTSRIIDRGWNPVTRKQYVRTRDIEFCSPKCGGNYQMGCEG
jgi:predicted nucleic acid-binding Zn ribbon protein